MTKMTVLEFKAWFSGVMDVIDSVDIDRTTLDMIQKKLETVDTNTYPSAFIPTVQDSFFPNITSSPTNPNELGDSYWFTTYSNLSEPSTDSINFSGLN